MSGNTLEKQRLYFNKITDLRAREPYRQITYRKSYK